MILIADSGSTKTDWITLDNDTNQEVFKLQSLGLNPSILSKKELKSRILSTSKLSDIKENIQEIYFYGAGCGTPKTQKTLHTILKNIFTNASITVSEDLLAAVYATTGNQSGIVCILGTGSNSCYFDGKEIEILSPSLGYSIMDEASGNYFGKLLLRDYYYKIMPKKIAENFEKQFDLDADFIKLNLYKKENPNMFLASFAKFMFDFKTENYIQSLIKNGFDEFFKLRVLTLNKPTKTPIHFVGSISYYFRDILKEVAQQHQLEIVNIIQKPIENLVEYHKTLNKL